MYSALNDHNSLKPYPSGQRQGDEGKGCRICIQMIRSGSGPLLVMSSENVDATVTSELDSLSIKFIHLVVLYSKVSCVSATVLSHGDITENKTKIIYFSMTLYSSSAFMVRENFLQTLK